jgi:PAS domain S-box-containing protein
MERKAGKEIRLLKLVLEQSPATVLVTGLDGTIEYVNAAFRELTGYASQEVVGRNIREFKSGQHGRAFYEDLWRTILGGQVWRGRFNNRKKNGDLFWEKATIAPVFDEQGQITCFVAMKEDVTELLRTEEALRAAKLEAEAASLAKSAFLANMSHEIRTPLNAVLGFIDLLRGPGLTSQQQDYLDKAGVSARHLHAVINEILDFSRIDAGRIKLETVPFDLRETLDKVAGSLSRGASEKGLQLDFDLGPGVPALLLGDPLRLGQVLQNLGDNAVKFTESGAVTFTARVLERARGRVRLRFEVRDTGIGMTEGQLGRLFQPFTQADDSSTRRFGGTGLGLAIASRLARLMGGDLEAASRPGRGSTFSLVLALPEAKPESRHAGPRAEDGLVKGVDVPGTLVRLELDLETYLDLLRRFAAGQAADLEGIRAALARGEARTATRLAHALKGAALNLGAGAVGAAARELEQALGGGAAWRQPLAQLQARLEELQGSLALVPAQAEAAAVAAPDWPAIQAALATLRQALGEDDAKAGRDLLELAALLKGGPLEAALAPMKARIENYDYRRALELFPAFAASVERARVSPPR